MAIRQDHDLYDWAQPKRLPLRSPRPGIAWHREDDDTSLPVLSDTLLELACTVAGFAGAILLIYVIAQALTQL